MMAVSISSAAFWRSVGGRSGVNEKRGVRCPEVLTISMTWLSSLSLTTSPRAIP